PQIGQSPPCCLPKIIILKSIVQPGRYSGSFQLVCNGKELPFSHLKKYRRCYHDVEFMVVNRDLKRLTYPYPILKSHANFALVYSIAFQIKILGALSVGDGRKRSIPSLLPSQNHYLKRYNEFAVSSSQISHSSCIEDKLVSLTI
ncbi:MAG: hypothetical protein WA151_15485, partial [Desulfatirhabdiaceae bacterium]